MSHITTVAAIAAGSASLAAAAGYHLLPADVAFVGAGPAVAGRKIQGPLANAFKAMFDGLRRSRGAIRSSRRWSLSTITRCATSV